MESYIFLFTHVFNLLKFTGKSVILGVDREFLSTAKTYELDERFTKLLLLESYFTKLLEKTFSLFLPKILSGELIYQTLGDTRENSSVW